MSYRQPRRTPTMLIIVILLGVVVGVAYQWGEEIIAFATGQDILDDLAADLAAAASRATLPAAPSIGGAEPSDATPQDVPVGSSGDEGASLGFPGEPRKHVLKYTVQPGDALFTIAEKFGLHPNTIFWANTETLQDNVHLIYVGTELYILPENGVYHTSDGEQTIEEIASLYGVTPGDILYSEYNNLADKDSNYKPPAGLKIVVPGGRREFISWRSPIQTGTTSGRANPEGTIHPGSCRQFYTGTGGSGAYINPMGLTPYRWTQDFVPWHPALDFASDEPDAPIYAAETGVVVFAGWHREGYGELIIIDHGDGWTTYYGHLSQRYVQCGDQVSKGQMIGLMGNTGNSSGTHLHFEIRHGDIPQDPKQFITVEGPIDYRGARTGG
ncbi:MAG TPA: LysM peptidoglycan-binding domain-containing M23 family metallopeptidase [Aggregatilineales bacterium]|nr:peptidoglycan DD-metalloendopeptidase family protein [Chloroflexota bacterium]HOA22432.1 LysM peptidoglycan-binding domain-containing M23 family metallopeptidase [Aggregatilineales bacterium]HQA67528.1 LysM peptidoglycan-binding domain-containing M23 family metallopeptidase [Aggregatilineales bacterium]HQE17692.1 LysM peptidoglycan-binding domain-containing M23 family metallopeptidase [Aggregatilineales bacterium]